MTTSTNTATTTTATATLTNFRNLALTGSNALKAGLVDYKALDAASRTSVVDYLLGDRSTVAMGKKLYLYSQHEQALAGLDDNALVSVLNALSTLDDKGFNVTLTKK